jgi:hypothetical protein
MFVIVGNTPERSPFHDIIVIAVTSRGSAPMPRLLGLYALRPARGNVIAHVSRHEDLRLAAVF